MDDLKKLSLTELKGALESVNKAIEGEQKFMGIAKDAFIENGEVCLIHSTKLMKLKDLTNEKTGKPLYNEKQIERVRKYIDDMKILYKRHNNIVLEKKRREWGDEFFDNLKLYDLKEKGTKVIYHDKGSMREFLISLIKEEKYKYILMNKIRYDDERFDDKKYIVYALLISKPKGDYSKIEAGEITIDGLMGGIASAERELWRRINLKKPEPIKKYLNIDIVKDMNFPEKRLIRKVEKEAEEGNYKLVVEKGDEHRVNYLLYDSDKYYEFIISMEKILLDICKEWNDEEYLRVIIDLNSWKRKEKSTGTEGMLKSLSEIYGKYELWYVENNLEPPELDKYILKVRAGIVVIISRILELIEEKKNLGNQKNNLENEFESDIRNFPDDLSNKLESTERDILKKQQIINEFEKRLWGILGKEEGLIYKHDRLVREFKKMKLGDDYRFEILDDRSTEKMNKIVGDKIKSILSERQIKVDEYELNELLLKVIGNRLSNEEQFYEEVLQPEKVEQNVNVEIVRVLNERYNFNIDSNSVLESSEIKFATPRLNRDQRIIELNDEIADLEYQKMIHKNDLEYVKSAEGLINGRRKELRELTIHLIGDFLLKNNIKEMIRNEFEKSKNITGVNYLNEIDYDKLKNYLIEEGSNRIFNMITNNELDKKLDDSELFSLIKEEIQKVLPELDTRFAYIKENGELKRTLSKKIPDTKPEVPTRQLKNLAKEACEQLIEKGVITKVLTETKKDKCISPLVIALLEEKYILKPANKNTIHTYFRKLELELKLIKGKLTVVDNYRYKK